MEADSPTVKTGLNEYYSASELAAFLGVHRVTVYRLGERGEIPRIKIGSLVRFPAREINEKFHLTSEDAA